VFLFFRLSSSRPVTTSPLHRRSFLNARWFSVCFMPLRKGGYIDGRFGVFQGGRPESSTQAPKVLSYTQLLHCIHISHPFGLHKIGPLCFFALHIQRFLGSVSEGVHGEYGAVGQVGPRYRHWCYCGLVLLFGLSTHPAHSFTTAMANIPYRWAACAPVVTSPPHLPHIFFEFLPSL
jgi:hypothetical protein